MYTWNFQYVSKVRLAETFQQLSLNDQRGDILIRIHTSIHLKEEAVDLAKFIKNMVPNAQIFGTSTSAVINSGRIANNQCLISVSQMTKAKIKTALFPAFDPISGRAAGADELCRQIADSLVTADTRLMLAFFTPKYQEIYRFVEKSNEYFPDIQMTGGVANLPDFNRKLAREAGFLFNENGWSEDGLLVAAFSGKKFDALSSFSSGVQAVGRDHVITKAIGGCILEVDNVDAAREYRIGIGEELYEHSDLANLFPIVYSDADDVPVYMVYYPDEAPGNLISPKDPGYEAEYAAHPEVDPSVSGELVVLNHNVIPGRKVKRAFIYDKKIVADNRMLFRRIENFEKVETIFAYACVMRNRLYPKCVKWELSAYENSNISGCVTAGEIVCDNGRNVFANGTLAISVMGEKEATQEFNPYALSYTGQLRDDNKPLLHYLVNVEMRLEEGGYTEAPETLKEFVRECGQKLLASEIEDIPEVSAMNLDIRFKGYDRICIINITDSESMKAVFSERLVMLTYKNYLSRSSTFARAHNYRMYIINQWVIAIGAPSYMVSLQGFVRDMEVLQKELFETTEESIAIVPMFCVIDGPSVDSLESEYNSARVEMVNRNIQFLVKRAGEGKPDEQSIRERYHMVNVINYAISHNSVVPYYQGIYDNKNKRIHHYESLMRIMDENGKIYYPNTFLDVARQFGLLYDSISKIMIRKVFEKFMPLENLSVSINLGYRDITNREVLDLIYDTLSTAPHPENFIFEILESEDIEDYNTLVGFVEKIHELGAQIAIDDFGSGFSNLQHIMSIRSDYIKIDGSIIRNCCESQESENLIALISGWKDLCMRPVRIVAEFVENEEIQNKLLKYNVDFSQGYLFSKPESEIEELKNKPRIVTGVIVPLT